MPLIHGHNVFEITVSELQDHFDAYHFSSSEYVAHCIEYIRHLNPYLEAVIEINPDAISIAKELDIERLEGKTRGPLHGIPVLVKDNMATKDLMQTTAGSWALFGSVVSKDAVVVSRLRTAGAVVLGKSNMSEWASLRSKKYSTGYSARGGQSRNPYNLRKSPWGSSSGSAIAVSANMVPLAIGTETDSSIIGCAAANGVVGIKPTVGLTSRSGVVPISLNMDSVGPFGRTVADAVSLLDVIVSADPKDPSTEGRRTKESDAYELGTTKFPNLKGVQLGLPQRGCWELVDPSCKVVASKVLDTMRRHGMEILEVELPSIEERLPQSGRWDWEHGRPDRSEWTVVKVDAYNDINAYLANLDQSPVRTVEEVVEYNKANAGTEGGMPGIHPAFPDGQANFVEMIEYKGVRDAAYCHALDYTRRQTRENGIDGALRYRDPKTGQVTMLDGLLFCDRRGIGQQYAAQAGYPIVCIPIGLDDEGIPVSLSLQDTAGREPRLIDLAGALEYIWKQENGGRARPGFRNLGAKNIPIEAIKGE